MARNIRLVALAIGAGFGVLALALVYWQVVRAADLTADPRFNNARLAAEASRVQRGRIIDRNGLVLAETSGVGGSRARRYHEVALAHLVGYYSGQHGATGIERHANGWLGGDWGSEPVIDWLRRSFHQERVGVDVILTVEASLQRVADIALGDQRGAVVALDPRTGAVLAMVSHPLFNPNDIDTSINRLLSLDSAPLVNRAAQGLYPPGSTFKVVTLAAALDTGAVNAATTFSLEQTRSIALNNFTLTWDNPVERSLTLAEAFVYSCNTCFADIGLRTTQPQLRAVAGRFGFEAELPIEIEAATSRLGRAEYLNDRGGLGFTAFGQGELTATPLQMALVAATIANRGVAPTPFVIQAARDRQGRVLQRFQPGPWRDVIKPETARFVGDAMVALIDANQAPAARLPGVKVAGKTGTAEVRPGVEPHAWFIAYAPADDPKIAVAAIIENGGFGSRAAAPVAARVLAAALGR